MKTKHFLLLYLVLILSGGTAPIAAESLQSIPEAEIQESRDFNYDSTWPSSHAVLFSSPFSSESGFNFRDPLPESNTEEDHESPDISLQNIAYSHHAASGCIRLSKLIDGSQTTRKLLFPFHSFL